MNVPTENSPLTDNREQSSKLIKELFSKASDGNIVEFELDVVGGFGPLIGYLDKTQNYLCAGRGLEKERSIDLERGEVGGIHIKRYRILS